MLTALGILAVLALILANGYFVAAEFSYVAARRTRLEEQARSGEGSAARRAARAVGVSRRLSFMLSGAQLGITASSLVVGYIAGPTIGEALRPLLTGAGVTEAAAAGTALTVALVLATGTQMVLGELAPKNLAIARPEPVATRLASITVVYLAVAGPLIRLFDGSANLLLRTLGIEPVEELAGGASPEELQRIIEASTAEGELSPAQAALLSRVLEFRELRAGDAMVPRPQVVTITADATCAQLRQLAVSSGHSRFPVVEADLDEVLGVVQAKDVLGVPLAQRASAPVRAIAQPALAVPESALLGPLLGDMREAHMPLALVVDEYGDTAGIVTLEDIVEELVGAIQDEYDPAEARVQALAGGAFLVPGGWRVDEVERETGVALPHGDWDTVGGLVMAELGRVPQVGDEVALEAAALRVETLRGLAVGMVRLVPVQEAAR